jgi:hypothetical protein
MKKSTDLLSDFDRNLRLIQLPLIAFMLELMHDFREDKSHFLGYLGRSKVMQCCLGSLNEEMVRETYRTAFFRNSARTLK